jgi:hypothetical protein
LTSALRWFAVGVPPPDWVLFVALPCAVYAQQGVQHGAVVPQVEGVAVDGEDAVLHGGVERAADFALSRHAHGDRSTDRSLTLNAAAICRFF